MSKDKIVRADFGKNRTLSVNVRTSHAPTVEIDNFKETDNPILQMAEKLAIHEVFYSENDDEQLHRVLPRIRQLAMTPGKILQALEEDPPDDLYRAG